MQRVIGDSRVSGRTQEPVLAGAVRLQGADHLPRTTCIARCGYPLSLSHMETTFMSRSGRFFTPRSIVRRIGCAFVPGMTGQSLKGG